MTLRYAGTVAVALAVGLASCGGGGGGASAPPAPEVPAVFLTESDVQAVISQAVGEAVARGVKARIAVSDRTGSILAMFAMDGAVADLEITSGLGVIGGLDGLKGKPLANLAAVSKAVTAAYLSSNGNAFTTRTASQIIQDHFNPRESQQPSGPLYGVQFSQLLCSDVMGVLDSGGPRSAPLGLAGDPGGVPLYKNGVLAGAIGVEIDGIYTVDLDIDDIDENVEEQVAVAGTFGFAAPADVRADRITADGRTLRFVDSESLASEPSHAPAFASLPGQLQPLLIYFPFDRIRQGRAFGTAISGVAPAPSGYLGGGAWQVVDSTGTNRFPVIAGPDGKLTASEVEAIIAEALAIAKRARGQIRRPLGSTAQVSITVVDSGGAILGLVRTPDAPIFGIDVAVQKARTAAFFSSPKAAATIESFIDTAPQADGASVSLKGYLSAARTFLGDATAFTGATAWSARAISNIHRPTFPDGIDGTPDGPLSTPKNRWSPFNLGFQLDLVFTQLTKGIGADFSKGCASRDASPPLSFPPTPPISFPELANGIQIFPGGVPIYRGNALVGAIGVSGDGVDQDDMIAFLGLANAGRKVATGIGNAPAAMRADRLTPQGTRLRYVQCPQSPFNDSTDQNVCAGL